MSNPASVDIREREEINATLASFFSLPTWTPAMGAMLVSGVMPIAGTTVISTESKCSLRNPTVPAGGSEIHKAGQVLKNWIEWYVDSADGLDSAEALCAKPTPQEFLIWCEEEYENQAELAKPDWLSYWMSFAGFENRSGVPLPAPGKLVGRAAELEQFASVVRAGRPNVEANTTDSSDKEAYVAQMRDSILANRKSPIASLIIKALTSADDPQSPLAVWVQLVNLAKSEKHPALLYVDETSLKIPAGESAWKRYSQSTLQQYLNRHKPK